MSNDFEDERENYEGFLSEMPNDFSEEYPIQTFILFQMTELAKLLHSDGFVVVFTDGDELQQYLQAYTQEEASETLMKLRVAVAEAFDIPVEELL